MLRFIKRSLLLLLAIVVLLSAAIKWRYGGGEDFPKFDLPPASLSFSKVETVANLPLPPGNVAVSKTGRVFITLHPEARPKTKVAEIVNGKAKPWPSVEWQNKGDGFVSPLSLRIDGQNRLWVLDNANHGLGQPFLAAFDIATGEQLERIEFADNIAGLGSHLNDFQVSTDGRYAYIADASIMALSPAIIVTNLETGQSRRLLDSTQPVMPEPYVPVVQGRRMEAFGLFSIRPGIDSITLSRDGQWLYFAAVTARSMYRVKTANLLNTGLAENALLETVETFAPKPATDGLTSDNQGRLYLSDPDNNAILRMNTDGSIETLLQDSAIRWPDGFSFGPENYLYFTCSSLQEIIGKTPGHWAEQAPYQLYRVSVDASAAPGH